MIPRRNPCVPTAAELSTGGSARHQPSTPKVDVDAPGLAGAGSPAGSDVRTTDGDGDGWFCAAAVAADAEGNTKPAHTPL